MIRGRTSERRGRGPAFWIAVAAILVLPACATQTPPAPPTEPRQARDWRSLSPQEAMGERRGAEFLLSLRDGSQVRGWYKGRDECQAGMLAIRRKSGMVSQVPLDAIQSVEVRRSTNGDWVGYGIMLGMAGFLAWIGYHLATFEMP